VKKCLKSSEPPCLLSFRTTYPADTWDRFCDQAPECYTEIRQTTSQDQGGLCAYCELDLAATNQQIAHFHPKSDCSSHCNWALEWSNMWLACKGGSQTWMADANHYLPPLPDNISCDECKGNKIVDDLVLSPADIPAFPRIFCFRQLPDRIKIEVDADACRAAKISAEKAQCTIDTFNLNCTRLALARLGVHRELEQAIKWLRETGTDPRVGLAALARRHLSKNNGRIWPRFFTLIRWRLGNSAEDYLQSINYIG
jgi:uncharacterized protein (TIGR02646 family)